MLGLARWIGRRRPRAGGADHKALAEEERRRKIDEVWSVAPEAKAEAQGWYWMQHDMVRERINRLVSGNRYVDVYGRLTEFLDENGMVKPLHACVSLGCGFGGLERDLLNRGLIGEIDGYDLSEGAVAEARRLAEERGLKSIRYHVADMDRYGLPEGQFDAIFAHSSVHHVEALEALFENVRRALKPEGIFHLNEFVGPSRFQWTDGQLELINEYLDSLPERLRQTPTGRKPAAERPTIEQMLAMDPTEAVRSAEIRGVVRQYFDVVEERPYGGTLLHMGLAGIAQNFDMRNHEDVQHLQRFFDLEDQMIARRVIGNDFTVLIARPPVPGRPLVLSATAELRRRPTRQLRPTAEFTVSTRDNMLNTTDDHYLSVGKSAMSAVERALGGSIPHSILDLPCGFGRVTRFLRARYPDAAITVSDLDESGVAFSAEQFAACPAISIRDFRDLDLGERYDLIWVGSLITHLPAVQTTRFFASMARHLTPQGRLVVSLQGPSIIPKLRETGYGLTLALAKEVIEEFERAGFGYRDYPCENDLYGVALTNEHYGISLTGEPWLQGALAESGLQLGAYEVLAWDNHHDVLVASLPQNA
jgi:SAM-dependent methyltransferase